MKDCLFCDILDRKTSTELVYKDKDLAVFADINPKSRVHLLIVSREHIKSFLDLSDKNNLLLTKMIKVIQRIIRDKKLEGGYQVIFNGGRYQHIPHLHWHLLGD
jgi:histidine triad (HIT) family protein